MAIKAAQCHISICRGEEARREGGLLDHSFCCSEHDIICIAFLAFTICRGGRVRQSHNNIIMYSDL